jgi:DNA polymerase (family 10)
MKDIPTPVFRLLEVPTFGPKKAYKLVTKFKLANPDTVFEDVKKLAEEGRIAELEGFGQKSEADILRALEEFKKGKTKTNRMPYPFAFELAEKMIEYLKKSPNVVEALPLGSLRRKRSTIGDIDIAVATKNPQKVLDYFTDYPYLERIIEKGTATSSILTAGGKQIDLMTQNPDGFGSLLQHFTGSKQHNVHLREYALRKGLSLSEYGIKEKGKDTQKKFKTEEEFYHFLGLDWISPEIREDEGEIELALKHQLPKLVELKDIKGDLHIHSSYPIEPSHDLGRTSMSDLLEKAKDLHYEYLGFSEHNPSVGNHTEKEIYQIMKKRYEYIEEIKKNNKSIRVINLLETDILADGKVALPDNCLEFVDGLIVSVHSVFSMDKEKMTKRILKGLSHPKAKILAHPTARLINQREGLTADWNQVFEFAAKNNKALEINSWPTRLDLPDTLVKQAKEMGVKFVIDTDTHDVIHMNNMLYGVSVARRGWCTKEDILNTLPFEKFYKWIKQ